MKHTNISASQSVAATAGGPDIDVSAYVGPVRFVFNSFNTAGSSPTHDRKIQGSNAPTRGLAQTTAGATDNQVNTSSTVNTLVGVKFTQSGAHQIKNVALMIKKIGTLASGKKLTLTIQSDSAGLPSGTVIATAGTVDIDTQVGTAYAWTPFTFANPVDLADATVYHFVVSGNYTASSSNCCDVRSLTAASGGTLETKTDTTWSLTATEKVEVYVDQYTFADISGLAQTQATGTVIVNESKEFNADLLPQFVRVYDTIGGTSSPAFIGSCSLIGLRSVQNG